MPDLIVSWTARICVAMWLASVVIRVRLHGSNKELSHSWLASWTAASFMLLFHTVAAFHFRHDWSHTAALVHTADQTESVVGIRWGGGLYFNYLFLVWWLFDAVWGWTSKEAFRSPRYRTGADVVVAFMMSNATVVFGPPAWRFIGPAIVFGLVVLWRTRRIALDRASCDSAACDSTAGHS